MVLPAPNSIYGLHSIAPYDILTGVPLGPEIRVASSSSINLTGELIELRGGSSLYPYATERGAITGEVALTFLEYPSYLFSIMLGNVATDNAAEATGSVSNATTSGASVAPDNLNGTSVVSVGGLATVDIVPASGVDLKFGKYVIEAVSATTVDVYGLSDVDFATGANASFVDETMKLNAVPLTITAATGTALTNFGIELTGAAGPIAMTVGDTAEFKLRPINQGSYDVSVGLNGQSFKNFGAVIAAQRQGSGSMVYVDAKNITALGMPIGFNEKEFSSSEVTMRMNLGCDGDLFDLCYIKSGDCQ